MNHPKPEFLPQGISLCKSFQRELNVIVLSRLDLVLQNIFLSKTQNLEEKNNRHFWWSFLFDFCVRTATEC